MRNSSNLSNILTSLSVISSTFFAAALLKIEKNRDKRFNKITTWCTPDYFVFGSLGNLTQIVNLNVFIENRSGQPINDLHIRVFVRRSIEINEMELPKSKLPIYESSILTLPPNIDSPPYRVLMKLEEINSTQMREILSQTQNGSIKSIEFGKVAQALSVQLSFRDLTGKSWLLGLNGKVKKKWTR
jgi:hypothetical protein